MASIILPTYNSIRFLAERVDTIINQTYTNWECIVIDGESTDGTWEYLSEIASTDNRFRLYQYPPKGVYDAWNKGIEHAKGDYIYFATSDDTMTTDCLEKLRYALDKNTNCDIAHCCLNIIDSESKIVEHLKWDTFPAQQFYGDFIKKHHTRLAPLDGLLYCTHNTVYHSFTQLLIRREVFKRIGLFLTNRGSIADFEWGMRVGLSCNTIHVPGYLATWRLHDDQSTSLDYFNSWKHKKDILILVDQAINNCKSKYKGKLKIHLTLLRSWYKYELVLLKYKSIKNIFHKKAYKTFHSMASIDRNETLEKNILSVTGKTFSHFIKENYYK